jgi:SulP family sulfate permease
LHFIKKERKMRRVCIMYTINSSDKGRFEMSILQPKICATLKDYSLQQFIKDIISGMIVAIIALPLSIALAIASGVTPEKGLYTAIVAGFFISLLGGSRVQIGGPTGAFMVIVYGIVMTYGIEGLTIATILAGLIMILLGLMRFGSIIKFIPYPITTGFTSGIALTIFTSQINDFFGLGIQSVPVEFIAKWQVYASHWSDFNGEASLVGMLSLIVMMLWPKVNKKIPGALIALIISSIAVKTLGLDVATIGSKFGTISSHLPTFSMPHISLSQVTLLIGPAFTIAVLGSIESLLSAVVSDGMIGGKHRSNMELIAQGVANIMSACFGGIPATGAIARTVANVKNGGRTPVAGIVHAMTLMIILVVMMPLAKRIPLTALAAVLMMVAYNMSEWREFKALLKSPKSDILILLMTFSITVLIDLVKAIEIGMVLAAFLFMKRMADVTEVNIDQFDASEESEDVNEELLLQEPLRHLGIRVYEINGPFFFGAADKFLSALKEMGEETAVLIIRMRHVPSMDATALHAFSIMIDMCKRQHTKIVISGIQSQPKQVLMKSEVCGPSGMMHFCETISEAIELAKLI